MKKARFLRAGLTAALLMLPMVAWAQDEAPAAPGPEERLVELFTELGDAVGVAGTDCAKVATAITDWSTKNGPELKTLATSFDAKKDTFTEEESKALEAKIMPATEKLMGAAMQCADNEAVQKAFETMDAAMNGSAEAPAKE